MATTIRGSQAIRRWQPPGKGAIRLIINVPLPAAFVMLTMSEIHCLHGSFHAAGLPFMVDQTPSSSAEFEEGYPYAPRPAKRSLEQEHNPADALSRRATDWSWLLKLGPVTALYSCLLACDFAIVPLMDVFSQSDWGALWVYASAGGMMAQGGILSVVAVFLRASFWLRMGAFCAAVLLAWWFWVLGMLFNSHVLNGYSTAYYLDELRLATFGLPLLTLAIQMPLWPLRLYLGWELCHSRHGQPAQPLRILDYLLCTGAVALAIAAARLAVEPAEIDSDYWTGLGITCAIAAGISLAGVPPALWLLFRWQNAWLGWAALIIYSATATALTLAVLQYINTVIWHRSGILPEGAIVIVTVFVSFGGFLGGALFLLRATGFFLVTRREQAHA